MDEMQDQEVIHSQDSLTYTRQGNEWVFSDGTRLPVVSGAEGDTGAGTQGTSTQNSGTSTANEGDQTGQGSQTNGTEPEGGDYSLAAGFLSRVPEEHRSIVEPYVKQWDAGVTRRFQELHSQYAPYAELGDVEDLQAAMNLASMLQENPWQVYGILQQAIQAGEFGPQPQDQNGVQGEQGLSGQNQFGQQQEQPQQPQIPQEYIQRMDQLQQAVVALGQHILGQQQEQTTQQEDAQLDEFMENLHTEFGDFDDRWVLSRMLNGASPDEAIQEFNDMITQRASGQLQKNGSVPPILGAGAGGNGAPTDPSSVKNLSRNDTKSLVASIMASAQNNGS